MASGDASNAVDSFREVVPRRDTLIAEVIGAGLDALVDGGHDGHSEVAGVCWRTYLVEDNA